jgi:alpha-beta hydrolase superfamily lysophospholipase
MLAGAAAFSGVGYLVTAYTVSRWLTRRSRCRPRAPAEAPFAWEDVACRTQDGHRLAGWVVTPPEVRGTVALFHGLRHSRMQTLPRIALLAAAGYRCVAFDHRAHGQSTGRFSSFGFHEARDVAAVLDFIDRRWPAQSRAALGISMGAAALCFAAGRARGLDACILESLYHDVASAFENRIGSKFPSWFQRFARGVIWVTERRLGLRLHQITPADHIANLAPVPLLLITGSADQHAPPADQARLSLRCTGPCKQVEVAGADHGNLCAHGGDAYRRPVLDFLERHLGAPRSASPLAFLCADATIRRPVACPPAEQEG